MCALHLEDVDQQTGNVRVRRKGDQVRHITLGPKSLEYVRSYLAQCLAEVGNYEAANRADEDFLFSTERGIPVSKNSIELLFWRLRNRAKRSDITVSPQILRHSFALRYLQAGGDLSILREMMGYKGMDQIKLYLHWHDQLLHHRSQAEQNWSRVERHSQS
jgi:site-specific recombinase XerD